MLSIFTLSILGAFGASSALTGLTDDRDAGRDEDDGDLPEVEVADGLGGQEDLIERLDMYAALGMKPPVQTPTSEAFLPAEDPLEIAGENVFDLVDDALVADLTPEELELLSQDVLAAQAEFPDDGEPDEVISVAVGGPGVVTPDAAQTGFRTQLGPGDELELNIAPDLPGEVLAVHSVFDAHGDDTSNVGLRYALSFYMLPPGQVMPEDGVSGSESGFIEAHGLQKLGELDMGRFAAHVDPTSGETVVTDDSRQSEPPHVLANRPVTELTALFAA